MTVTRVYHPPLPSDSWQPDFLGGNLYARSLPLPRNGQGEAAATLIHDRPRSRPAASFAVLYVHGWSDYFFNREMAEFFTTAGGEFYAVDLHASGRSLRPHQVPCYVSDLRDYFPDLDAAAGFIAAAHPGLPLVVVAHSQGGLTAVLWARQREVAALVLNSPWLDQPRTSVLRALLTPVAEVWGRVRPLTPIPIPSPRLYERVISQEFQGEWPVNDHWRPDVRSPSRPGWARAILRAQNEVSRGIDLPMPILTLTSHASLINPRWREEMRHLDVITDVRQTWRRAAQLGRDYQLVRIRDALHDVFLSPPTVRERAYRELAAWLDSRGFSRREPPL